MDDAVAIGAQRRQIGKAGGGGRGIVGQRNTVVRLYIACTQIAINLCKVQSAGFAAGALQPLFECLHQFCIAFAHQMREQGDAEREIAGLDDAGLRRCSADRLITGGIDPIATSAQIVNTLQTIVSRRTDIARAPAVVTVGAIKGGIRYNIVPESVEMIGTVRTFETATRDAIWADIKRMSEDVAHANGAEAEVELWQHTDVLVNDPALTARMRPSLEAVVGRDKVVDMPFQTVAEDFAALLIYRLGRLYATAGKVARRRTLRSRCDGGRRRIRTAHHADPVIVGDDHVTGLDRRTGAPQWSIGLGLEPYQIWTSSTAVVVDSGAGGSAVVTAFTYDPVGQVTRVTLPDGSYLDYGWDAAHRLTRCIGLHLGVGHAATRRMIEDVDAIGAGRFPDETFDLRVIDPAHLLIVEEVLHGAAVLYQGEPVGIERYMAGDGSRVADLHRVRFMLGIGARHAGRRLERVVARSLRHRNEIVHVGGDMGQV